MVIIICKTCGKHITVPNCRKDIKCFCSRKCAGIYNSKNRVGKNSNRWIENKTKIVCKNCAKTFEVTPSQEKRKFCSIKCSNAFKVGINNGMYGKKHSQKTRLQMSKNHADISGVNSPNFRGKLVTLEWRQKQSESHKGQTAWNKGIPHTEETKIKVSCHHQGIHINEFCGFLTENKYCFKFNTNLKIRVRVFFNNVCFVCGKTSEENGKNLSVHHVNYDKMVCCNDVNPLFVPLCHSCHSKTGNRRVDWTVYFEKRLEEEYDNKCFYTKEEYELMGVIGDEKIY